MPPWTGLAIILALILIGWVIRRRLVSRRVRAVRELADRLGLTYQARGGRAHEKYDRFDPMGVGRGRVSDHLMSGRRGDVAWDVFDYHFVADKVALRYAVAAATVPARFERVTIRPQGLLDRFRASAGFDDINFESDEFNRRFHVSAGSRAFAHALLHARAMELLLSRPARHWQFDGDVILVHKEGPLNAEELEETIHAVEAFAALIPPYMRGAAAEAHRQ
jgi:hypothetical protein